MSILSGVGVDEIRQRGTILDSDVLAMRRAYFEDGHISETEARDLIRLNEVCHITDPAWAPFFIEALTDYIVNQVEPEGYVVAENARWLIEAVGRDGRIDTPTELELIVNVIDKARWSPPSLSAFVLDQVRQAVVHGEGVTRAGLALQPGIIGSAEIDLIRRVLYAFGGDGSIAVTRAEADALIDINRAIAPDKSNPDWTELFVKAVGSSVLAGLGHQIPSREEALRREAWTRDPDPRNARALIADAFGRRADAENSRDRIGRFLGSMMAGGVAGVWGTYRMQSSEERALARLERQRLEIVTQETIDEAEANWLISRLGGGRLDANEQALLAFVAAESPSPHPELKSFAARHGVAA